MDPEELEALLRLTNSARARCIRGRSDAARKGDTAGAAELDALLQHYDRLLAQIGATPNDVQARVRA